MVARQVVEMSFVRFLAGRQSLIISDLIENSVSPGGLPFPNEANSINNLVFQECCTYRLYSLESGWNL